MTDPIDEKLDDRAKAQRLIETWNKLEGPRETHNGLSALMMSMTRRLQAVDQDKEVDCVMPVLFTALREMGRFAGLADMPPQMLVELAFAGHALGKEERERLPRPEPAA